VSVIKLATPKWVGYDYFCHTTSASRSTVEEKIRNGKIDFRKDRKKFIDKSAEIFRRSGERVFESVLIYKMFAN
jgi:hypothetical protein